jgi:hypothetical protein
VFWCEIFQHKQDLSLIFRPRLGTLKSKNRHTSLLRSDRERSLGITLFANIG